MFLMQYLNTVVSDVFYHTSFLFSVTTTTTTAHQTFSFGPINMMLSPTACYYLSYFIKFSWSVFCYALLHYMLVKYDKEAGKNLHWRYVQVAIHTSEYHWEDMAPTATVVCMYHHQYLHTGEAQMGDAVLLLLPEGTTPHFEPWNIRCWYLYLYLYLKSYM